MCMCVCVCFCVKVGVRHIKYDKKAFPCKIVMKKKEKNGKTP